MDKPTPKKARQKKIVFSEEIDGRINGLTLGFAFICVGIFLLLVPDYFGNKLAGQIVRWVFVVLGILGLLTEFKKLKPISDIKGFDDLWTGIFLLAVWSALYFLTKNFWCNIAGFCCLVLGIYGAFLGFFRIIYSIHQNRKNGVHSKSMIGSDVLIFSTKIVSLALVVLQLIKAIQQ